MKSVSLRTAVLSCTLLLSLLASPAYACSYLAEVQTVWPTPDLEQVGTNGQIWMDSTGVSIHSARLVDEDGTAMDVDVETFSADIYALVPKQELLPQTQYTVDIVLNTVLNPAPEIPGVAVATTDIENNASATTLTWSFTTGDRQASGISNQTLTGGSWTRVFREGPSGNSCTYSESDSIQEASVVETIVREDDAVAPVIYRFETIAADGSTLGIGARFVTANQEESLSLGHSRSTSLPQATCARWVAIDAYGFEVRTEEICQPSACALSSNEDINQLDADSCNRTQFTSSSPTDGGSNESSNDSSDEDTGCTTTSPNPNQPLAPWTVLLLLGWFTCALVHRKKRAKQS